MIFVIIVQPYCPVTVVLQFGNLHISVMVTYLITYSVVSSTSFGKFIASPLSLSFSFSQHIFLHGTGSGYHVTRQCADHWSHDQAIHQ